MLPSQQGQMRILWVSLGILTRGVMLMRMLMMMMLMMLMMIMIMLMLLLMMMLMMMMMMHFDPHHDFLVDDVVVVS